MNGNSDHLWTRAKQFVAHDIWELELSSLSGMRRLAIRGLRVVQLVVKGFREDQCLLHASALTYSTLMALVPLLAIVFSVLKGLGAGQEAMEKLKGLLASMPPQFEGFVDNLHESVTNANVAAVGWIGVIALLIMVVQMLSSIEWSFNQVWGIKASRNLLRKTANYISIVVVVPILIMAAVTMSATIASAHVLHQYGLTGVYRGLLHLTPLFAAWLAFAFLYVFMPNTRVQAMPALISGFIGALLWLGWQRLYIVLQVGVARYNVLYGTFLSVPIFLAWLYFSWVIVLLGAEIAFGLQNHATYQMETAASNASSRSKLMLALSVVLRAAQALHTERPRLEVTAYAKDHVVPVRLLNEIIRMLVSAGLLAETAEKQGCYVLLRSPEKIRVADLVDIVLEDGARPESLGLQTLEPEVSAMLGTLDRCVSGTLADCTIRELLEKKA